jgi:hypothetical protein
MCRWSRFRIPVVLLLLVAPATAGAGLTVGTATGLTDTGDSAALAGTDGGHRSATSSASAAFAEDELRVERGDLLTITVVHSETAHLHLGGEGSGYHLEVTLSGSGRDVVTVDTYNSTGQPDTYVTGGNATLHSLPLARPLAPTRYVMNVTIGGVEQDLGTVLIEDRSETTIRPYVRPPADLETVESVDREALTQQHRAVRGELVVLEVNESGLEQALNPADLSGGAAAEGIRASFVEADPGLNQDPHRFTPGENVSVVTDLENDRLWLVWDTSGLAFEERTKYDVNLTLNPRHNDLVETETTLASTTVTITEPDLSLAASSGWTVYPWEPRELTVTGETNLVSGTAVEVRGRATDPQAFLKSKTATVSENGTFRATFDLADVPKNSSFPVWVLNHREETESRVVLTDENASVSFRDQAGVDRVTVQSASLGLGGFVRIVDSSGQTRGVSDYLEPGTHEGVRIRLDPALSRTAELTAVAVMDRDDDRSFSRTADAPYTPNGTGSRIADVATVAVQQTVTTRSPASTTVPPPSTPTPVTTSPPARTAAPAGTETPLTPVTATAAPLPPFLAVLAVVLAGLLASRFSTRR